MEIYKYTVLIAAVLSIAVTMATSKATVKLNLLRYKSEKICCGLTIFGRCTENCDPEFKICLDQTSRKIRSCKDKFRQDDTYGFDFSKTDHLFSFALDSLQEELTFTIRVQDYDSTNGNDEMDTLTAKLNSHKTNGSEPLAFTGTPNNKFKIRITATLTVECDANYYGAACNQFCENSSSVYFCDNEGHTVCIKGYEKNVQGNCILKTTTTTTTTATSSLPTIESRTTTTTTTSTTITAATSLSSLPTTENRTTTTTTEVTTAATSPSSLPTTENRTTTTTEVTTAATSSSSLPTTESRTTTATPKTTSPSPQTSTMNETTNTTKPTASLSTKPAKSTLINLPVSTMVSQKQSTAKQLTSENLHEMTTSQASLSPAPVHFSISSNKLSVSNPVSTTDKIQTSKLSPSASVSTQTSTYFSSSVSTSVGKSKINQNATVSSMTTAVVDTSSHSLLVSSKGTNASSFMNNTTVSTTGMPSSTSANTNSKATPSKAKITSTEKQTPTRTTVSQNISGKTVPQTTVTTEKSRVTLTLNLLRYKSENICCGYAIFGRCTEDCDPEFKICLDVTSRNIRECRNKFRQDNTYGFDFTKTDHSFVFAIDSLRDDLTFTIRVQDYDSTNGNDDMDTVTAKVLHSHKTNGSEPLVFTGTPNNKFKIQITATLTVECDANYYGAVCNQFCDNSTSKYICDNEGHKICISGYEMNTLGNCVLKTTTVATTKTITTTAATTITTSKSTIITTISEAMTSKTSSETISSGASLSQVPVKYSLSPRNVPASNISFTTTPYSNSVAKSSFSTSLYTKMTAVLQKAKTTPGNNYTVTLNRTLPGDTSLRTSTVVPMSLNATDSIFPTTDKVQTVTPLNATSNVSSFVDESTTIQSVEVSSKSTAVTGNASYSPLVSSNGTKVPSSVNMATGSTTDPYMSTSTSSAMNSTSVASKGSVISTEKQTSTHFQTPTTVSQNISVNTVAQTTVTTERSRVTLTLNLLHYQSDNVCCGYTIFGGCTEDCDPQFKICLDVTSRQKHECKDKFRQDNTYGFDFSKTDHLFSFALDSLQDDLTFTIRVEDYDSTNGNDDMDTLTAKLISHKTNGSESLTFTGTPNNEFKIRITASITVECDTNYFGPACNQFCDNSTSMYICDNEGHKICREGYSKSTQGDCVLNTLKPTLVSQNSVSQTTFLTTTKPVPKVVQNGSITTHRMLQSTLTTTVKPTHTSSNSPQTTANLTHTSSNSPTTTINLTHTSSNGPQTTANLTHTSSNNPQTSVKPTRTSSNNPQTTVNLTHTSSNSPQPTVNLTHTSSSSPSTTVNFTHSSSNSPQITVNLTHKSSNNRQTTVMPTHISSNNPQTTVNLTHTSSSSPTTTVNLTYTSSSSPATTVNLTHTSSSSPTTTVNLTHTSSSSPTTTVNLTYTFSSSPATTVNLTHTSSNSPQPAVNITHSSSNRPTTTVNIKHTSSNSPQTTVNLTHTSSNRPTTTVKHTHASSGSPTTTVNLTHTSSGSPTTTVNLPHTSSNSPTTTVKIPYTSSSSPITTDKPSHTFSNRPQTTVSLPHTSPNIPTTTIKPTHTVSQKNSTTIGNPTHTQTASQNSSTTIGHPTHTDSQKSSTTIAKPTRTVSQKSSTTIGNPTRTVSQKSSTTIAKPTHTVSQKSSTTISKPTHTVSQKSSTTIAKPTHTVSQKSSTSAVKPVHTVSHDSSTTTAKPTHAVSHDRFSQTNLMTKTHSTNSVVIITPHPAQKSSSISSVNSTPLSTLIHGLRTKSTTNMARPVTGSVKPGPSTPTANTNTRNDKETDTEKEKGGDTWVKKNEALFAVCVALGIMVILATVVIICKLRKPRSNNRNLHTDLNGMYNGHGETTAMSQVKGKNTGAINRGYENGEYAMNRDMFEKRL